MADDAQSIAERSAGAMWANDTASQGLGLSLDQVGPGMAVMSMAVTERMVNGLGLCHGGYIFLLADSASAFASNSRNQRNVASHCQIMFLSPASLGARLVAEAQERHRGKRTGIYDVAVKTADGTLIAEFRGVSRDIPGKHFD